MGWLHQGCLVRCLTCLSSFQRRLNGYFLLLKMHEMVAPGLFGLVLNKFEFPPKGDTMVQPCCWSQASEDAWDSCTRAVWFDAEHV